MMCFRDRTYCSAFCATAECSRRWTTELQEAADVWWNPKQDPLVGGAPVAFANYAPMCPEYRQPDPDQDHRELEAGEANT